MKDLTLSSKERQDRIRDIMSGRAMPPTMAAPTWNVGDGFGEEIGAVAKGDDANAASLVGRDCTEERIAVEVEGGDSNAASLVDRRDRFAVHHAAEMKESDTNGSMGGVPNSSSSSRWRREDVDAKIARKLSRMSRADVMGSDDDVDDIRSNAASLVDRRDFFVVQHMAEMKESDMSRSMGDVPNSSSSFRWRREDIDAKIARKLSRMSRADVIGSDDDDDDIRSGGDDGDVGIGSLPLPEEHFSYTNDSGRNDHYDDDTGGDGGFVVGLGSLPLPKEHSPDDTEYPQQQHPEDIHFGLAVATAIDPDGEEAYIYNAIEYDPDSKPPLHKNRRFRVYSYLALLLITSEFYAMVDFSLLTIALASSPGILMHACTSLLKLPSPAPKVSIALVVIFATAASKSDEIVEEYYTLSPSISPTQSPITDRMTSGILEQLEAGVLRRGEIFASIMNKEHGNTDPRVLALNWILHIDNMQLLSDDINLYQRYALAVLAYTLDSRAWFQCGDPGENYTEISCLVLDANSTKEFGSWLSSTSECTWFGVICSDDGVVRGVDLNDNGLIGTLPYELNGECACFASMCSK
jgi:hypothetical protein